MVLQIFLVPNIEIRDHDEDINVFSYECSICCLPSEATPSMAILFYRSEMDWRMLPNVATNLIASVIKFSMGHFKNDIGVVFEVHWIIGDSPIQILLLELLRIGYYSFIHSFIITIFTLFLGSSSGPVIQSNKSWRNWGCDLRLLIHILLFALASTWSGKYSASSQTQSLQLPSWNGDLNEREDRRKKIYMQKEFYKTDIYVLWRKVSPLDCCYLSLSETQNGN